MYTALVAVAAVIAAPAGPAALAATTPAAVPYPLMMPMSVGENARMVYAQGHLFVTRGPGHSDVRVYSTSGQVVRDITDDPGAFGMAVSADGSTVYVADATGSTISVINATTFSQTKITVDSCPTSLAFAAGRLFYSWGCPENQWQSGVSSIDPTSPTTPAVLGKSDEYQAPLLSAGDNTLLLNEQGESPGDVKTYTADSSGALTPLSSLFNSDSTDVAVSPDGAHVLMPQLSNNKPVAEFDASSFKRGDQYGGGNKYTNASAVAYSPDGEYVAAGLDERGDTINLYKRSVVTAQWERFAATSRPRSWLLSTPAPSAAVLPGSITFAPDDSHVYGLMYRGTLGVSINVGLFSSVLRPGRVSARLSLAASDRSRVHTATVTLSKRGQVVMEGTYGRRTAVTIGTYATSRQGMARIRIRTPYNGSLQAVFEGSDALYPAASATKIFTVPAKASITVSGSYGSSGGIELFHSVHKVRILARVTPVVINRPVEVVLEDEVDGRWHADGSVHGATDKKGRYRVRLTSARTGVVFRVELVFHGDQHNPKASAVSHPFEIT